MRVWLVLIATICGVLASHGAGADDLKVLSYNVHGVPPLVSFFDRPGTRIPIIAERIVPDAEDGVPPYDVALLQEDFAYKEHFERRAPDGGYYRGNGRIFRWGYVPAAPILGLFWITPRFRAPTGAGLTTLVVSGLRSRKLFADHYSRCGDYVIGGNDCFAAKGFLGIEVTLANGAKVHLYNTHLEAGFWNFDRATRRAQLEELALAIDGFSKDQAVIVVGDFNSRRQEEEDHQPVEIFAGYLGLNDSGARREPPVRSKPDLDYILYRSGKAADLDRKKAGQDQMLSYYGSKLKPLSDHPAIYAIFEVTPVP